jgi:hypothetical protein
METVSASCNVGQFLSDYTAQHPRSRLHTRRLKNLNLTEICLVIFDRLSASNRTQHKMLSVICLY